MTCNYCSQLCKKGATKELDGVVRDFCSEDCCRKFQDWYYKASDSVFIAVATLFNQSLKTIVVVTITNMVVHLFKNAHTVGLAQVMQFIKILSFQFVLYNLK